MKFKKGDRILRLMFPQDSLFGKLVGASVDPGFVTNISDDTITCKVATIDVPRVMTFDKSGHAHHSFVVTEESIRESLHYGEVLFSDRYIISYLSEKSPEERSE